MKLINPLRKPRDRSKIIRGAWCVAGSSMAAETLARSGFDYVTVDMQHGVVGFEGAITMLQAISAQGCAPLVRVPANDLATIGRMLDVGAVGVIVPMVESAADAQRAVAACRYPPLGSRSYGPIRAAAVFDSSDPKDLGKVMCAVMIETREGLANVEDIAAVPGIDVIYVGPVDLAISLGLSPSYEPDEQVHQDGLRRILDACQAHDITAGIHCDGGQMAARRIEEGFHMVTLVNDLTLVHEGARAELAITATSWPQTAQQSLASSVIKS